MTRIAFFNNKGGVGKTTLVCNIAHHLAARDGMKVLLVDLDPQCNTTQLVLDASKCAALYWPDEAGSLSAAERDGTDTIYEAVRQMEEGEALPAAVTPTRAEDNRFKIDLIPGHPRMSVFEDLLGQWFREAQSGEIAGLRKTLWLNSLLTLDAIRPRDAAKYDVILFDVGPSLGALNRSVLAASDRFITPMGADIFSIVALRNIAEWVAHWSSLYAQGVSLCIQNNPGAVERFDIEGTRSVAQGFAGYTVQQYSTVTIRGERRATQAYDEILNRIPTQVETHLRSITAPGLSLEKLKLGDVPNLRSLVPLAQSANSPLAELNSRDGLTGGQYSQQRSYVKLIDSVTKRLKDNCLNAESENDQ